MTEDSTARAEGLRDWARGMTTLTAAAELLIRCGPPLLTGPWVEYDDERDRYWFNTEAAAEVGYLSGGERRMLDLAASLASDDYTVALGDAVSGLGRDHLDLALAAIAAAAGSHEHSIPVMEEDEDSRPRIVRFDRPGSLHPWPATTEAARQ